MTIVNDLFTTFVYWKSYSVGDLGKALVYIRIFIGVCMRITSLLLVIAPSIGIFGLLAYYHIDHKSTYNPEIWSQYKHIIEKSMEYDWYILLSIKQLFICFICGVVFHIIVVGGTTYAQRKYEQNVSLVQTLQHGAITLLVPIIYKDWDVPNIYKDWDSMKESYIKNWYSIRETFFTISLSFDLVPRCTKGYLDVFCHFICFETL